MRAYEVAKGTKGFLLFNPEHPNAKGAFLYIGKWQTKEFYTRKDLLFTGESMIISFVDIYNNNTRINPNGTAYRLAERGYYVFTNDAYHDYDNGQPKYLLAIPQVDVGVA